MIRFRVRHFQSISDTTLTIEGFTVITGPSNRGKSALLRAIEGTWFGIPGDYYVRRGENRTNTVYQDTNHKLRWQKVIKKKVGEETFLEVNQTKHTKLGREHQELTEPLGFRELKLTTTRLRPQSARQHDPIFLLTENETTVAEALKLLGRTDTITTAQQLARQDTLKDQRRKALREEDRDKLERELLQYPDTDQLNQELEQLQKRCRTIQSSIDQATILKTKLLHLLQIPPTTLPTPLSIHPPQFQQELRAKLRRLQTLQPIELPTPPTPIQPDQSNQIKLRVLQNLTAILLNTQSELRTQKSSITYLKNELEQLKQELGTCPTCNRRFDETDGQERTLPMGSTTQESDGSKNHRHL